MKRTILFCLPLVALIACASAPTKFEQSVFDIKTNIIEKIELRTNLVTINVPVTVYRTNEIGAFVTNIVTIPQLIPQYVTLTNTHEEYVYTPKPVVAETAQTAGAISNLIVPGSGGLVLGIISGLATMWAKLRSSKQVGSTLAQDIETMREFLKVLPNGLKYDAVLTQFMQQHQAEAGVLNQVLSLLQNNVSNKDAQIAATELQNAIASLLTAPQPAPTTPAPATAPKV